MREFMLTNKIRPDYDCYSVTLTIAGPALSAAESKKLFHIWDVYLSRLSGCALWRLELQKRGALHWHCIVGVPSNRRPLNEFEHLSREDLSRVIKWSQSVGGDKAQAALKSGLWCGAVDIYDTWHKALKTLGPCSGEWKRGKDVGTLSVNNRSEWPGADRRAVLVETLPDIYGAWKRYLQDHTTKTKQEQIGDDIGRHWGKIGKRHFESVAPVAEIDMTWKQYASVLRCYHRLCTPFIRCPSALFGKRRGYTSQRGRSGRSVSFSNPETMRRLCEWSKTL